jgi:iron complex outermembrane receptor protein
VWGWGWNLAPRLNWKISDEQTLNWPLSCRTAYGTTAPTFDKRVISGSPVLDDDQDQHGSWANRRLNATWNNRFSEDQRIELKAGVQQSRWSYDVRNLRQGAEYQRAQGGGDDDGITQAGKYSLLLGESQSLTAGWDLENRKRSEERVVTSSASRCCPTTRASPSMRACAARPSTCRTSGSSLRSGRCTWACATNASKPKAAAAPSARTTAAACSHRWCT